jgi:hypothetical protein
VSSEYAVITTQTGSLRFGCGAVQQGLCAVMKSPHKNKAGKDREFLIPYCTPPWRLTGQRGSGIKSGINSHIEKVTLALAMPWTCLRYSSLTQLQSLATLSPFHIGHKARCHVTFYSHGWCAWEVSHRWTMDNMADGLMPNCALWTTYIVAQYWFLKARNNLSDWLVIQTKNHKALVTESGCFPGCWDV